LRQTCRNGASVDPADFQGDYLAAAFPPALKEPICVLLTLQPADDAPTSVSMHHGQRHRLRAVLGNAILVMLVGLIQVRHGPRKYAVRHRRLYVHWHGQAGRVAVPSESKRRTSHDR
jgi:hypothetical protein